MKEVRYKTVKKASILGITGNIFLMIIKGVVSILTNSQAMLADTLNSASDILSSLMTYIGNKISSKPQDEDHNLGHGKAEYIFSLLISITMILMTTQSLKSAILSLFTQKTYTFSIWLVVVCIITIITKLSLYIYTNKIAKKFNNILMEANSKDHRNDCVITTFNLLSCILSYYNIHLFDGIVGIGISFWIILTALKIFKDSYDVLMDKTFDEETKQKVLDIIQNYHDVKKIDHFNATPVGYKYQISFTIYVNGTLSTFESHEIANKLEKEINSTVEEIYLTVIHVNPIETK